MLGVVSVVVNVAAYMRIIVGVWLRNWGCGSQFCYVTYSMRPSHLPLFLIDS